jgi:hypothetical protein
VISAPRNVPRPERVSDEVRAPGVFEDLSSAFAAARDALSNFLELIALEARRAGLALVWMIACGLVAALCIAAAWLGLMAALALWVVSLGLPPIAAAIVIAAINLAAGAGLLKMCTRMSRALLFSAVRRQVAGQPPAQPRAP